MRLDRPLILLALIFFFMPAAQAVCTTQLSDAYPGWEPRFNGSVVKGTVVKEGLNGTLGMKDLSVEVLQILGGEIVNVRVGKKGVYEEDFSITKSTKNFDVALEDLRIKVDGVSASSANITVYTHDQALINASSINLTYASSDMNTSLPGEEIDVDILFENVGELEAEGFSLVEDLGGFEILEKDVTIPSSFCSNTSFKAEYKLKAPESLKEDTNYTLYFKLNYEDHNAQLLTSKNHEKEIKVLILIKPAKVTLFKTIGNWTLLNQGREVTVFNSVNNTGNTSVFEVFVIDTPPEDLIVVEGQPSLRLGDIDPGKVKTRSYTVISNDPLICESSSKAEFEDELGNKYTSHSEPVQMRFSPFVTITKTILDEPVSEELAFTYPIKTRRSMKSDFTDIKPAASNFTADAIMKTFEGEAYHSLCQGSFLNGSEEVCIGDDGKIIDNDGNEPKVIINRTAEIIVQIRNAGNTIARDIIAYENITNLNYSGVTNWSGTLAPGETASYRYQVAKPTSKIDITTQVNYTDVDPLSLIDNDIEGFNVGVCTKKQKEITFFSSGNFSYTTPDLVVDAPHEIKVYEDSPFDFDPIIYNNGSENLFDVEVTFEFGDLTLIKGQGIKKIDEFGRGFRPFREDCNIAEWDNQNITRSIHLRELLQSGKTELIYQILNGSILAYVDGKPTPISDTECSEDGYKFNHDVTVGQRYPFHEPPEPDSTTSSTKEINFTIRGNPDQIRLGLLSPSVEDQQYIPLITTVTYEDFYGNRYVRRFTTDVFVVPATAGFVIIRKERADLGLVVSYSNVTDINEPGEFNLELISQGFGEIKRYRMNLTLPANVELATNDTNWTGRVEAEIKRANDSLFIFSGLMSREGNISRGGSEFLPMTIRGLQPGSYNITYTIIYDGKELSGEIPYRVRGPVLKASKELSKTTAKAGDDVRVIVKIENIGDSDAFNILATDRVPGNTEILTGSNRLERDDLSPGEIVTMTYVVSASNTVDIGETNVGWQDSVENTYTLSLDPVTLKVTQPTPAPTKTPRPTTTPPPQISSPTPPPKGSIVPEEMVVSEPGQEIDILSKEGLSVLALTIIVVLIVVKLLTVKKPVKEED